MSRSVLQQARVQGRAVGGSIPAWNDWEERTMLWEGGLHHCVPKPAVTVSAKGMGVRNLQGCENPFTAKKRVDGIAKEFGL